MCVMCVDMSCCQLFVIRLICVEQVFVRTLSCLDSLHICMYSISVITMEEGNCLVTYRAHATEEEHPALLPNSPGESKGK